MTKQVLVFVILTMSFFTMSISVYGQAAGQHVHKKTMTTAPKNRIPATLHKSEGQKELTEKEAMNLSGEKLDDIGYNYYVGRNGKTKNIKKAVQFFRWSAEKGYPNGQFNLGCMYYYGEGVEKDYSESYKWFSKSAEQGHAGGQNNIGWMYENGQYVNKDISQACRWYHKAIKQRHTEARKNLAKLLKEALLLPQSSTDIAILTDGEWEATKEGLLFGHYAGAGDKLEINFTLTKSATISFDWSVERSYAYNGNTSPDIKLYIDTSSSHSNSIEANENNKSFSDHVTITLESGWHSLRICPNYTGKFRIMNLLIL